MYATITSPAPPVAPPADIELTIIMPCLNEARTVGRCVAKAMRTLEALGIAGEILVADNGSKDGSQAIASEHGARVIHVHRKGYGSAIMGGVAAARGRYIIMGDADDSYDFTAIEPFVDKLRRGFDLVMGNRFQGGIRPGAMPWHHKYIGNPILSGILNLFFHSPIGDAHCGLRAFTKDAFNRMGLTTPGMEFASEMVVKASIQGLHMTEVPVVLHPDGRDRPPHLRSFRDGWRHLRFLLLYCPLWLYLIPSAFLMCFGLCLMAWLTQGPRQVGSITIDLQTMYLGALATVAGYQGLWLWALSRKHGYRNALLPRPSRLLELVNLEGGLIVGGCLLLGGLCYTGWVFRGLVEASAYGATASSLFRYVAWGMLAMLLGVQTIYSSFFWTTLGLGERADSRA